MQILKDTKVDRTTPTHWKEEINKGLVWRKKTSREQDWSRYKEYYEHAYENVLDPHFNLIYMMGSVLIPSLVFQNPGIINIARRPEFNVWAQYFDGIDNWLVDEMEVGEALETAVLSCFLQNTVAMEFGYDFPEDYSVDEMSFPKVPGTDRTRKYNQPFINVVDADKLVLAKGTTTSRNCGWYAKFVHLNTESLRNKAKRNKNFIKKNIETTHVPPQVLGVSGNEYMTDMEDYTGAWLIHDAESEKWGWLSTNDKWILPMEEDPLQVDGLPMDLLSFNKGIRSAWGTPDVAYVETQHVEGDESRKDGRLQRREALVKGFYDSNILDEDDIKKYLNSNAMGMIPVEVPLDKKLQDCLHLVQPHVQMELFEYDKQRLNDAQLILGHGPNQLGTFAPGRRTAKETAIVEEQSFLRLGSRRGKVSKAVANVFGKINQIIIKHWKAPHVAKVIGVEGAMHFVQATPAEYKDLSAQLVTKVNVESLAPISKERKKQEMVEVMGVIAKVASATQGQLNIIPVVQSFLSQFDWVDMSNTLPMAQQNGPSSMQEFQGQQQGLQQNPQALAGQLQQNLGGVNNIIGWLPAGPVTEGEE